MKHQIRSLSRVCLLTLVGIAAFGFASVRANTILINFNNSTTDVNGNVGTYPTGQDTSASNTGYWNNVFVAGASPYPTNITLVDSTNAATSVTITMATTGNSFGAADGNGYSGTALDASFPHTATNSVTYLTKGTTGTFTLSGLNPALVYNFTFLSSRGSQNNATSTGRIGDFSFAGANTVNVNGIDAGAFDGITADGTGSGFGNGTLSFANGITPTAGGVITITDSALNATAGFGGYLAFLKITTTVAAPEPSTVALAIIGGLGMLVVTLRRRQTAKI